MEFPENMCLKQESHFATFSGNVMIFYTLGDISDTFWMGPNGTQSRCVKSLRDGRWDFTVLAFFRSKAFYASRLSPKRRFRKTQKWFRVHFFTTCTAMSVKIGTPFHTLRPKWKLYTFVTEKSVAFRVNFRAKVKMNHFDSFWVANKPSRWDLFFVGISSETLRKPMLFDTFCSWSIFWLKRKFNISSFSENPNAF